MENDQEQSETNEKPEEQKDKPKHPGGRPTIYKTKILAQAKEYLKECEDEEVQQTVGLSAKGTELYKNKLNVKIPSIEGLSAYLHINKDTLYEWAKIHPKFSDVLDEIRVEQAERLINKGLSGDYNPTIAKLLLMKHGYAEKSETDLTTKGQRIEGFNYIVPEKPKEHEDNDRTNVETAPGVADTAGHGNA